MKKKLVITAMLVSLLTLGSVLVGCPSNKEDSATITITNDSSVEITHVKVDCGGDVTFDEDVSIAANTSEDITITTVFGYGQRPTVYATSSDGKTTAKPVANNMFGGSSASAYFSDNDFQ